MTSAANYLASVMPWWSWALVANLCIIATEYVNRHATGSWFSVIHKTGPLIVVAQFGLFCVWKGAPSWYVAWIVFTLGNSVTRALFVASTSSAGEIGNWYRVLAGVGVMLAGSLVIKSGIK